jgi:hypothetical protein
MTTLYVYAFCGSAIAPFTLHGRRVRSVEHSGIHVAVDRKVPDEALTEASLRRQHAIVEAIAARAEAVLPARAGSSIDEAELRSRIGKSRVGLEAALDLVRGRQQMTLRLAAPPLRAIDAPRSGTAYLEARRTAAAPPADLLDAVRAAVSDLVHGERVQPARGGLPAAVFHLIGSGEAGRYRRRIDAAPSLAGARPQVTGPFPPFAFTPELAG